MGNEKQNPGGSHEVACSGKLSAADYQFPRMLYLRNYIAYSFVSDSVIKS